MRLLPGAQGLGVLRDAFDEPLWIVLSIVVGIPGDCHVERGDASARTRRSAHARAGDQGCHWRYAQPAGATARNRGSPALAARRRNGAAAGTNPHAGPCLHDLDGLLHRRSRARGVHASRDGGGWRGDAGHAGHGTAACAATEPSGPAARHRGDRACDGGIDAQAGALAGDRADGALAAPRVCRGPAAAHDDRIEVGRSGVPAAPGRHDRGDTRGPRGGRRARASIQTRKRRSSGSSTMH